MRDLEKRLEDAIVLREKECADKLALQEKLNQQRSNALKDFGILQKQVRDAEETAMVRTSKIPNKKLKKWIFFFFKWDIKKS